MQVFHEGRRDSARGDKCGVGGLPWGEWDYSLWLTTGIGHVKRFQKGSDLYFGWPERPMDEGGGQRFEKVVLRRVLSQMVLAILGR